MHFTSEFSNLHAQIETKIKIRMILIMLYILNADNKKHKLFTMILYITAGNFV